MYLKLFPNLLVFFPFLFSTLLTFGNVNDLISPLVVSSNYHNQTFPHRLTFVFDQDITSKVTLNNFVVTNTTSNTSLNTSVFTFQASSNTITLTSTLSEPFETGHYRVRFKHKGITSHQLNFLELIGDVNNDTVVDSGDLVKLLKLNNYGIVGGAPTRDDGDFDGDRTFDSNDLKMLFKRNLYNKDYRDSIYLDPRIRPGAFLTLSFPNMPETYGGKTSELRIHIPENYSVKKVFPVIVFMSGGSMNPNTAAGLTFRKDFIRISVPGYHEDGHTFGTPIPGQPNAHYRFGSADFNFTQHKILYEHLIELFPNVDVSAKSWALGGFSNGAHLTSDLLGNKTGVNGQPVDGLFSRFHHFYFFGGGGWHHLEVPQKTLDLFSHVQSSFLNFSSGAVSQVTRLGLSNTFIPLNCHCMPASSEYQTFYDWAKSTLVQP